MASSGAESSTGAVIDAYKDAEHFLMACGENYFDPEAFRRNLNAYVQAARNISFRVQGIKGDLEGFDSWYMPWREYMKSVPLLSWVADARTMVTKRRGLTANSRAHIRVFQSYDAPDTQVIEVDPQLPTAAIVVSALRAIPEEFRRFWTVEISRRWEVDDLPGKEVLAGLFESIRIYRAFITDMFRFMDEGSPGLPLVAVMNEPPMAAASQVQDMYTLVLDPDSGAAVTHQNHVIRADAEGLAMAREVFGDVTPELKEAMKSEDLVERADAHIEMAKSVRRSADEHYPFFWLRKADGTWEGKSTIFANKQHKFLFMHQMAEDIAENGYDALIFVTDSWFGDRLPSKDEPYIELSEDQHVGEALLIYVLSAYGLLRVSTVFYTRGVGGIEFQEVMHDSDPAKAPVIWPFLAAWGLEVPGSNADAEAPT